MGRTRGSTAGSGSSSGALTSPTSSSSSSSSDFEFTVSLSPSSRRSTAPADELFYKGNLLPLHLSPRISMVRTLLLASSSTSSSSDATTSRDSNGSSSSSSSAASDFILLPPDCDSSRPSSATEEDVVAGTSKRLPRRPNYFSSLATRFSSVFINRGSKKAEPTSTTASATTATTVDLNNKKPTNNVTAKEVIKKYVKKVKPLYEKLSSQKQNQQQHGQKKNFSFSIRRTDKETISSANAGSTKVEDLSCSSSGRVRTHSFSGNLRYCRRKKCAGSCPSSMRSSPSHSGLLSVVGAVGGGLPDTPAVVRSASSSMEELQSAIQGAIAHCKSSQRKVVGS